MFISKHTRARVRACALSNTLRQVQPALSAPTLSELPLSRFFFCFVFFWRSGAANDAQLSVLKTGGGGRGGKRRRRPAESKTNPAAAAELLPVLRSGAFLRGECFLLYFGTFSVPGRRKEEKKEREGIGVRMT